MFVLLVATGLTFNGPTIWRRCAIWAQCPGLFQLRRGEHVLFSLVSLVGLVMHTASHCHHRGLCGQIGSRKGWECLGNDGPWTIGRILCPLAPENDDDNFGIIIRRSPEILLAQYYMDIIMISDVNHGRGRLTASRAFARPGCRESTNDNNNIRPDPIWERRAE